MSWKGLGVSNVVNMRRNQHAYLAFESSSLCSEAYSREVCAVLYGDFEFNKSGLTLEFRLLVGMGRSGVMIGRICLDMVS